MSQHNYIFDKNTLTLYNVCKDQTLDNLEVEHSEITSKLSESQKCQYKFWLSLTKSQREYVSEQLEHNDCVVAQIKLYPNQILEY